MSRYNRLASRVANLPRLGLYYWLPKPDESPEGFRWVLMPFFEDEYGEDVMHVKVWDEVLIQLSMWWKKRVDFLKRVLGNSYTGLPRGRVVKMMGKNQGNWGIAHGGDHPTPTAVQNIKQAFNLKRVPVISFEDPHERQGNGDPEAFMKAMKMPQLELKSQDNGMPGWDDVFDDEYRAA